MPPSLPLTRSAAAAISSATATWVTSRTLPYASVRPRGSVTRGQPGDADRGVGDAGAPRPSHRVADDHADLDAEPLAQRLAQQLGRRVGVDRQQRESRCGRRWTRRRRRRPAPGRAASRRCAASPRRGDDAHGLGVDRRLPGRLARVRVGGVEHDQPALDLRDDLGGHDEHVAVLQRRARARRSARRGRRRGAARRCRGPAGSRCAAAAWSPRHRDQLQRRRAPSPRSRRRRSSAAGPRAPSTPGHVRGVGVVDQPAVEQAAVLARAVVPADALGA